MLEAFLRLPIQDQEPPRMRSTASDNAAHPPLVRLPAPWRCARNLVLLCWRHHHDFAHHPKWHLKLLPDATVTVTRPDGITLTSRPPPPDVTGSFPGTEMPRTRREVAPGRS